MKFIEHIIIGIIIGIANIVPGVSAGTMFVILGIFKKLIDQVGYCLDEVKTMFKNIIKFKEKDGGIKAVGIMLKNIFNSQKTFLIPIAIGGKIVYYAYTRTNLIQKLYIFRTNIRGHTSIN